MIGGRGGRGVTGSDMASSAAGSLSGSAARGVRAALSFAQRRSISASTSRPALRGVCAALSFAQRRSISASTSRPAARGVRAALAVAVLAGGSLTAAAAEPAGVSAGKPSILVLTPSPADDRVAPSREAIDYWNDRLAELAVATQFAEPRVVVESPAARALENYARQVAQRATRLPAGDAEPPPPAALVDLDADVVLLLSRQDILSFTWPLPRVSPPRYLVVIRKVRGPYRTDPMVTRHVVAHELGHALGLDHNAEPHTLMCGPCQPLTAEPDATGFLPLTAGDRARLVELHGR